jgi:hypothetical protein
MSIAGSFFIARVEGEKYFTVKKPKKRGSSRARLFFREYALTGLAAPGNYPVTT